MIKTRSLSSEDSFRNINIDLLKIISCIAAIGLHCLQKDLSTANTLMVFFCGFAIPVFFFSSGYILLQRKEITFRYCLKKCLNIMRVVLIWNISINMGIVVLKIILGKEIDVISFAKDITYRPLIQRGYMWQFWYLGAMIILYMLLPIIHKLVKNEKKWMLFWGVSALICVCMQTVSMCFNTPIQKNVIQTFRIWTWIQYFSLGGGVCVLSLIIRKLTTKVHIILLSCWTGFNVVYQCVAGKYIMHNTYPEFFYDSFFEIIWIILLVSLVIRIDVHRIKKYILFFSPLIMGVFILHPIINAFFMRYIKIDSIVLSIIYFMFICFVSFVATFILSKLPFSKYILKI